MKQLLFLLLIVTTITFISCSKKSSESLQVTSPLPSGVLPNDTVIVVKFSHAVVKPESLNVWLATPFIDFTPAIPGKFTWQDTSTLIFSPDGALPGDMKFQAKLNTSILKQLAHRSSFEGPDEFSFSTQSFRLKNVELFYDRLSGDRKIGIKANLEFTYGVNPSEVVKYLKVSIDNEPPGALNAVTSQQSKVIPLEFGATQRNNQEKTIKIEFSDGLISAETGTKLKMDAPFVMKLPGIEELKIYGHEFGFDGTTSWITVRTSQEVDSSSIRSHLTLDPARDYAITGDRQSFTLRGKFEPGTAFHFVVQKGLESVLEGRTQNDYEADIVIGNVAPSFRFGSASGTYMLLGGERKIEIKTINLPKVAIRVSQVFQNNLVFFLDGGRQYEYGYYDEEEGEYQSYAERKYRYYLGNYGRQLYFDSIPTQSVTNREATTRFDLQPFLKNDSKGFYLVEIADPKQPWRSTGKLVSISNIGLIVKQSPDQLMVFATSLETNKPLANATINLISLNNQTIASMKTDGDGAARFDHWTELRKDFFLKLVTAELDQDFNFINLSDYRVETSRFDVSGKSDSPSGYDGMLYGDRSIYRPGETIIYSGIVRNLGNPLPARMPVRVTITNPRGTKVKEEQINLNEEGSFEGSYQTTSSSLTGNYQIQLETGNKIYLSSRAVSVEDFVPDRIRVILTASKERAHPGEMISYALQATNFFGPPAANRKYEFEGSYSVYPYLSKKFPEFFFSDAGAKNYSANPELINGTTDNNGKATINFTLPSDLTSSGLLRARGRIAVFDESGRPVYQLAQTTVYPKRYFIGIKNEGYYYSQPNVPQQMRLVAVDENDKPIAGFRAKIDLVRFEWHSMLRQYGRDNTLRYVSERQEVLDHTETVTIGPEPLVYHYTVSRSGDYVVRVSKEGDTGYNQFEFYAYSWGTMDATSFQIDPEARVQIILNDSVYTPGGKARILFQAPFDGTMLVTVERNQVFEYRYLDVVHNAASMELPIEEKYLPNVYISAVLFRKIKEMNIPLLVGHGFAPLPVEKKANKLDIVINAPEKIRPKTKQTITIKAGSEKNVFLTLAAVDEGILQLKDYKTPDPYGYFYAKKALQTETFDFFKHLLPEPERSSPGGSDAEMSKRVNPLGVQRFKPVSLWSGILKTDGNGTALVELDVPDFNGELRLMAFAYKGDRFGAAQRGMKVADPVVITPALPRFLAPNDSLSMPITAFNTTDKPVSLKFDVETRGGVLALATPVTLDLGANQERFVTVPLRTTNEIGKATVRVSTTAFGEKLESVTELPLRPTAPFAIDAISGVLDGGTSSSHPVGNTYLPFNRKAYVTLSPFPVANFAKELKDLVGYPYGCIEQTVSKAFPQIYLRDIATMLDPSILSKGSPTYFVNEAITKVTTMQMPDGGFSFWPGGTYGNDWATVYATHFLVEARKAGYAIQDATLKSAQRAILNICRSKKTQDYYYYGPGQKIAVKRIADKSAIYALYVLALSGSPDQQTMNFYRTERSLLTGDTQTLLAGAFALSGDQRTYLELLPPQFIPQTPQRDAGDCFNSPTRDNAIILNVLLETDNTNPNIGRVIDFLSRTYRYDYWYSTQDAAFTLLGLGKAARIAKASHIEGTVRVGNKELAYKGGNQRLDIDPFGSTVTISARGEGQVYYSIVTEGIRTDAKTKQEDRNLQVRREFFNRFGQTVDMRSLKQNDLVIVKLTVGSSVSPLPYVAVSDLLPAGLEIENPRVTETTNYPFIKNPSTPEYTDIRDDRINIYTGFTGANRTKVFYYMVRAVTAGVYQYPPVVAEAMYNGDYYSASGGGKVKVTP